MSNDLARAAHDPDGQAPLPFPAAVDYARTVMRRDHELDTRVMRVVRGVAYGSHRLQCYDVFAPANGESGPAPVLVFWHGGGWTNGYRGYASFIAPHVTARGFVLVTPSYRLAPEHRLPAAFDDSLAALRHVSANAPRWGGDATRLVLAGHSAGGHLAALVALRPDACRRVGVAPEVLRACLPISAILDLHHPAPAEDSLEARVYSLVLADPSADQTCSPLHWLHQAHMPLHLMCGEADSERVIRSNRQAHAALTQRRPDASLSLLAGHDHFQTHLALGDPGHPWYSRLTELVPPPSPRQP